MDVIVEIISIELIGGRLEVVCKRKSNIMYDCYPPRPAPDEVWKDIYAVVDGSIALVETVRGRHEPAYHVAEKITFEPAPDTRREEG